MNIKISIHLKAVISVLIGLAICFFLIHLYLVYSRYTPGVTHYMRLDDLFHLGKEANLPTWYSAMLLAFTSLLSLFIAITKKSLGEISWRGWLLLSLIFLYLSADESALLHERIASFLTDRIPESPLMALGWIVPGIIFVFILGIIFSPFVVSLPSKTRWLTILAGAIYLGGAILMELASFPFESGLEYNMISGVFTAVEEFLEMCGVILFIYTLFDFLRLQMQDLKFYMVYK